MNSPGHSPFPQYPERLGRSLWGGPERKLSLSGAKLSRDNGKWTPDPVIETIRDNVENIRVLSCSYDAPIAELGAGGGPPKLSVHVWVSQV